MLQETILKKYDEELKPLYAEIEADKKEAALWEKDLIKFTDAYLAVPDEE